MNSLVDKCIVKIEGEKGDKKIGKKKKKTNWNEKEREREREK